jgi:hypothetical protein
MVVLIMAEFSTSKVASLLTHVLIILCFGVHVM